MLNTEQIRRILIWPGSLRLAHGALAISVLGLIITGLLIRHAPSIAKGAGEAHDFLAGIMVAGLALRTWLLFTDKATGNWRALLPNETQFRAMGEMIKFYFTLGKYKLPSWHAHNPIWIPLYTVLFLILLVMAISGFVMESRPVLFSSIYLPDLHQAGATLILIFTVAHIITSILHDVKSSSSDVSAMLNGYRIFILDDDLNAPADPQPQKIQFYKPDKRE